MPKPAKRRVAIYARVSTQDQDPQMQLKELHAYAKHRTFTIAGEFIDHVSGATSERPELSKLWQAARARKIDTVLVWKFDRFGY
jgi:putative DNA-invertase from lambdoid prophage Rac